MGETAKITCSRSSNNCGWHQQKVPGTAPGTVIYRNDKRPLDISSLFSQSVFRTMATLTISGVQAKGEAVYFCVPWTAAAMLVPVHGTAPVHHSLGPSFSAVLSHSSGAMGRISVFLVLV